VAVGTGVGHVGRLDHRLRFLAEVVVRHTEDGDVEHPGVHRQDVLGFLGVCEQVHGITQYGSTRSI
jgi:hypothetical protein